MRYVGITLQNQMANLEFEGGHPWPILFKSGRFLSMTK